MAKVGSTPDPDGSVIKVEEVFNFSWDLKNFSKIQAEFVSSPDFEQARGFNPERHWQLHVYPKTENAADHEVYLGVFLCLSENTTDDEPVATDFQLSLLNSDRRIMAIKVASKDFKSGENWGFNTWIKNGDLVKKNLLTNDTLKIHCHLKIKSKVNEEDNHLVLVRKQMQLFLADGEFSDITLKTDSEAFLCSKIVLAAHSAVFRAMFSSGMVEAKKKVVKIEDFSAQVVQGMLEFIYSGEIEYLQDNAMDLLKIADKYDINGLKYLCAETLVKGLTINNAADTLILADLHGPLSFKKQVISYILRNRKAVHRTDGFILMKEHHKRLFEDLYMAME